ncbi:hypothetical protein K2173_017005 [Erythroxylum novogranatense]|uniref:non-specific serine/threonine protein kinase n=1 Tax=Erythroxylum novogranatense TaxID=1862640 RepID=A0AAV8U8Q3_9ROSI|nr:hypothetical protein K2173_017005 [Erythroxylum novogranatense]
MTTPPPSTSPTAIPSPPPEPPPVVPAPIPPPSVPPSPTPPLAPTDLIPPSFAPPSMSNSPQSPMSASSPVSEPPPVSPRTPPGTSPPPSVTNPPQSSPPPSTSTPPQNSPPPLITNTPPSSTPTQASTPPPQTSSPPKTSPSPPQTSSPPPQTSPPKTSPPPPQTSSPPKTSPPPPRTSSPPKTSPPPPTSAPTPENSPRTPVINPPKSSPPLPTLPPPPVPEPPPSSPPPPRADPPKSPPPPASSAHFPSPASPTSSPSKPPSNSPPAPPPTPAKDAPPPPIPTPRNPPPAPSPSKSIPRPLPPPPPLRLGSPSFLHPPPSPSPFVNATLQDNSKSRHSNGIGVGVIAAISMSVVVIILILIGLGIWCMKWRKVASVRNGGYIMPAYSSDSTLKKMGSPAPLMGSSSSSGIVISPTQSDRLDSSKTWFTYEEIVEATNGFSSQNLLGKGGFGSVYKGCLPDGREVAVKQLNIWGGQGEREFKAEVEIISRIHHRHLVSLVGYCISESQRLLLYDYVPNNTLHFHLHGEGGPGLDWATRFRIALGASRGLAYLHEDCDPRVIHRDIKSSNILLDDKFEAKVSDFGLAKMAFDANTHVTTRVMGTFGYMAPEYASTGRLTEKSDVFSFGVVLLELITGRKPVDTTRPLGDESLVEWARPLLNDVQESEVIDGLVDPRLGKNYIESEMLRMMKAAAACVRHSAAMRPRMSQVLRAFESSYSADLTNGMRVGSSLVFNSDIQSEQIRLFQRMAGGNMNYTTDFFSLESYNTQR